MKIQTSQPPRFATTLLFFGLTVVCSLWLPLRATPDQENTVPTSTFLGKIVLRSTAPEGTIYSAGLTDADSVIIVSSQDYPHSRGEILQRDIRSQKISSRLALSALIDPADLQLLPTGKFMAARENKSDPSLPAVQSRRVTIIDTSKMKVSKTFDVGSKNDISGLLTIPTDSQHVILKMTSIIPYENDFAFGKDRFVWLNIATGKADKVLPYAHATGASEIRFSPDKKYLMCLFQNDEDESDHLGIVDVLDPHTGTILWHLQGSTQQPIGNPFFFISPTQFVSSETLFDISTKTARPWSAVTATRKCLAVVPGHAAYAMFITPQGLELRDWRRNRTLRRWSTRSEEGGILWSPDLKTFSFTRDPLIQFWKFDPKWLH